MVTARTVTFIKVSDSAVSDGKECHVTNIHAHVFLPAFCFLVHVSVVEYMYVVDAISKVESSVAEEAVKAMAADA